MAAQIIEFRRKPKPAKPVAGLNDLAEMVRWLQRYGRSEPELTADRLEYLSRYARMLAEAQER